MLQLGAKHAAVCTLLRALETLATIATASAATGASGDARHAGGADASGAGISEAFKGGQGAAARLALALAATSLAGWGVALLGDYLLRRRWLQQRGAAVAAAAAAPGGIRAKEE